VWSIASEPLRVPDHLGVEHFAAFPQEWPRRLILGWCPESGVVLDPFAGTGTVPMVARALGRTGIGIDLSADYLRLADWRVFDSGHAAKTMRRTNAERQGLLL
jgi:DNA modification methylase